VFPAGLDFIVALFGCLIAGVIAVPMMVPRRTSSQDSSAAIRADCGARLAMTTADLAGSRSDVIERFCDLDWFMLDHSDDAAEGPSAPLPAPDRDDIAFLQYTSGSTSVPKGVVVTHRNLVENLEMIRLAFGNTRMSTYVNWVPLYHDMGLILNALQSLYVGAMCVQMAPFSFVQRPWVMLRAIHTYRAEVAGGPNFAFDLMVTRFRPEHMKGIDLSCWKLAFAAAEPVAPIRSSVFLHVLALRVRSARHSSELRPGGGDRAGLLPVQGGGRGEARGEPRGAAAGRGGCPTR
jgi:acyl-CoA synthetase (AMP-forming)/AMP-acid ligase II